METIKLTSFTKGAGCGCKMAPKELEKILQTNIVFPKNNALIVGNNTKDDAAVYDLGNGKGLISTTDFFTPIVDDPFTFGKIAAANAISDVYAMGGKPLLALAILAWPVQKIPIEMAQKVMEGAQAICLEAGISLAGGHSIDSEEPIFGLAVNGLIDLKNLKRNDTAKEGDLIYITKKIGVGILSTAEKRGILKEKHKTVAAAQMTKLNKIGAQLAELNGVTAMTDITGFGLLGHLIEMAEGSNLCAEINYSNVPLIDGLSFYTSQMCVPDNTFRNWNGYEQKVAGISGENLLTLCDPQTNGGLMISVNPVSKNEIEKLFLENDLAEFITPIGSFKVFDETQKRIQLIEK
ncbi:MAG TPA: selenide, water dikinase SelD [Bacteroidia bacterium]|nr:selenide, water dikinase SelD [Bacteroidia bacterium]